MHANWFGVICAVAALLACQVLHPVLLRWPLRRRVLFALVAAIVALPGASFALYYAHLLPEPAWYYEFRSWPGSELALVLLGVAGAGAAAILPRRLGSLLFVGVGLLVIVPLLKPFIGPIPDSDFEDRWVSGTCMQSTPSTCGPASVASVLHSLGGHVTEQELAREAYSYQGGTEAWYLARAIRKRGFNVRFDFHRGFNLDITTPAVAGVTMDSFGHFIAILKREGDRYEVADPFYASKTYSRAELEKRYRFSGFYMPISAPEAE